MGRFELSALDSSVKPAEVSLAALAPRRVRVIAEAIPLATFGMQLAERLGVAVAVAADVAGTRITIAASDVTLIILFGVLASEYDVRVAFEEGVVRFTSSAAYARAQRAHLELTPIATRIIPIRETVAAAEVAATYCKVVAGPNGSAAVVGHAIVTRDIAERLNNLEELVRALGAAPPPRAATP